MGGDEKDIQAYLSRIRKTIAESESLVSQAELRIAETDRMLERQGLTREQVMNFHFTEAQREAVNAELKRRGLEPLDWEADSQEPESQWPEEEVFRTPGPGPSNDELAERQRKFGMMMKPFQI